MKAKFSSIEGNDANMMRGKLIVPNEIMAKLDEFIIFAPVINAEVI